jgi:hypothetical protein
VAKSQRHGLRARLAGNIIPPDLLGGIDFPERTNMNLAGLLMMAVLAVPPNEPVANNSSQPYKYTQPTIRRFERRFEDEARQRNWESYCSELTDLWTEYRRAGSTPRAWEKYLHEAGQAKRRYVYNDTYLAPIVTRNERNGER